MSTSATSSFNFLCVYSFLVLHFVNWDYSIKIPPSSFLRLITSQVASFLLYLSDVEEGGETMFPYEVNNLKFVVT